jgi:hypothetical protein
MFETSISLRPDHLAMFARLGIDSELLAAADVHSITDQEAREAGFKLSAAADLSGVVFAYLDPLTGHRVTARLRRDHALTDAKYLSPYGDNRHLYFPPGAGVVLDDTNVPVIFVESEKAALSLTALAIRAHKKFLVVATGGCWGWRGKVGIAAMPGGERHEARGPLSDFDRIKWPNRTAIIQFDANATTNSQVRAARRALAEELEVRTASVKIADVPQLDGVNGPDDFLCVSGDDAVWAMLDSAQTLAETAMREADVAVAALGADRNQDPTATLEAIAAIPDPLQRTLRKGKVLEFKIPGLKKDAIERAVEAKRLREFEKRADAIQSARREQLLRFKVDPAGVISALERYYADRRHIPLDAAFIEALFAINTYTFEVFETTPYILYDSATGGCGKTTALERHDLVCARSYFGVDPSPAVLYRRIERDSPTFLLDEAKALQNHGDKSQELLALFDAGYKRGATVSRCVEHGEDLRDFRVYCPKVLARIGSFRGTLLDRGIVIHLEKAHWLRQKRRNVLLKEVAPIKESVEAYALQFRAPLEGLYQNEPDDGYWPKLSGREAEIWSPLLCHARLAGPEVEARALKVALRYSREKASVAIAEDRLLTRAEEALEVLQNMTSGIFRPQELVSALSDKESWGEHLADRKTDKARVTAVGTFFTHFRLRSRKHTDRGTEYNRQEAIEALVRHLPGSIATVEEGVRVSGSAGTEPDSHCSNTETSSTDTFVKASAAHPQEDQTTRPPNDTLTPEPVNVAPSFEEEL